MFDGVDAIDDPDSTSIDKNGTAETTDLASVPARTAAAVSSPTTSRIASSYRSGTHRIGTAADVMVRWLTVHLDRLSLLVFPISYAIVTALIFSE